MQTPLRRVIAAAVTLLILVGVFSGGAVTGRLTASDEPSGGSAQNPKTGPEIATQVARNAGAPTVGYGADAIYAGCSAPLGDVVIGTTIDPTRVGFAPRFPGVGWSLLSYSIQSQGPCDSNGKATNPTPVLTTGWLHDATGLTASIAQAKTTTKQASVLTGTYATFWQGGYQFVANIGGGYRYGGDVVVPVPATTKDAPSTSPGTASTGVATAPAQPIDDATARKTLESLVLALQPDGALTCFYRETVGSWDALASLGIGDPRSAIPSSLKSEDVRVTTFTQPAAGCDTSGEKPIGSGFSASWQSTASSGVLGLYISAYELPSGQEGYYGYLDGYGASWSNARYQFSIGLKSTKSNESTLIKAIAKALDPNFDASKIPTPGAGGSAPGSSGSGSSSSGEKAVPPQPVATR